MLGWRLLMLKRTLFIATFLLIFATGLVLAADTQKILEEADQLIKAGQYDTAFKLLSEADKKSENPEIVLKQVDIALNYFAVSTMHQMFAFKDLQPGETIEDIRGNEESESESGGGVYSYYQFEIDKILNKLIIRFPKNGQLYKALGEFYFEVSLRYGKGWLKPEQELVELAEKNCLKAEQNGVFDAKSLSIIGVVEIQKKNYQKAVDYLLRVLEQNSEDGDVNYNLAYAYLHLGHLDEGLKYAGISLNLYHDQEYKSDAARLMALLYRNQNDDQNAITYYKLSETISPNNYYNLSALLELYIKAKDLKMAASTADALLALDPTACDVAQDIVRSYYKNGQIEELFSFFTRMEQKYGTQDQVMGNLFFNKAYAFLLIKDFKQAKDCFTKARQYFGKCLHKDDQVFKLIDQELKELGNN
jgi:tetratricopeptide (TPR) repeat protein